MDGASRPKLETTRASEIRMGPVEFLGETSPIPKGKLITVAGLGGCGKGWSWVGMAADLTMGRPLCGVGRPGHPLEVLVLAGEDGLGDQIAPRLVGCGADMAKVHFLDKVKLPSGACAPFRIIDLEPLDDFLRDHPGIAMVIIDPIAGLLGSVGIKDSSDVEVRGVLEPLAKLADRRGVTILVVRHLGKDSARTSTARILGSTAFVDVPRAVFLVAARPDDPNQSVLSPVKWNLPERPRSFGYRREPLEPEVADDIVSRYGEHLTDARRAKLKDQLQRVRWAGYVDVSAEDLILQVIPRQPSSGRGGEFDVAARWLVEFLKDGPRGSIDCAALGDEAMARPWLIPEDDADRFIMGRVKWWRERILKDRLGGDARRIGFGPQGQWFFVLPAHSWPPEPGAVERARRAADRAMGLGEADPPLDDAPDPEVIPVSRPATRTRFVV